MSWRRIAKPIRLPDRLATGRVILRPFRRSDAEDLFAYANDQEWSRYITPPYPYQRDYADRFIEERINGHSHEWAGWCVEYEDTMAGSIDLILDPKNRSAEIAYSIARRYWNKGLITEAVRAVLETSFSIDTPLNRITARIDVRNLASIRVAEKLGFEHEGTLRQNRFQKGCFIDDSVYATLRDEWVPVHQRP